MSAAIYRLPRIRSAAERQAFSWRRDLERVRTGLGLRCLTQHLSDQDWMRHYVSGREPLQALLEELREGE